MKRKSEIEILNVQKIKRINLSELRLTVNKILAILDLSDKKISLVFCDNHFIVRINKKTFGLKNATDVISFPMMGGFDKSYLGEVVISVEEAARSAGCYGNTWRKELIIYLIHGILHLIGYDDLTKVEKSKMDKKQQDILKSLGIK